MKYSGKTIATKEEGHIYDKESTEAKKVRVDVKEEIMNNFLDNGEGITEETVIYDEKGGMEEEKVPSDIKEELEEGIVRNSIC
jgi:SPX domain protein involved in polyphosphate accumulation